MIVRTRYGVAGRRATNISTFSLEHGHPPRCDVLWRQTPQRQRL